MRMTLREAALGEADVVFALLRDAAVWLQGKGIDYWQDWHDPPPAHAKWIQRGLDSHEFFFESAAEMAKHFHFAPESIGNTLKIADMCNLEIPMGKSMLPRFPVPQGTTQDS